jgi:ADP-ribosylglycohydrolase
LGIPNDHKSRMERVRLSLEGLSTGDAFGERFFLVPDVALELIGERALPKAPWRYTDDTEMALAIAEVLDAKGGIVQDALAQRFAARYERNPERGYGGGAHTILGEIGQGHSWREAAARVFKGMGSLGNGGAMRAAPVGAYFADDVKHVLEHSRAQAAVTHAHPDGQAGAIAAALAAAFAWRSAHDPESVEGETLLAFVHELTPDGLTRDGIARAMKLPATTTVRQATAALGSGSRVLAWDTVPFALWCASRNLTKYEAALWETVEGLGDRDTTCAIVGGIVALSAGKSSIPKEWLESREPLEPAP